MKEEGAGISKTVFSLPKLNASGRKRSVQASDMAE